MRCHFGLKIIFLPREARDKHRDSAQNKDAFSLHVGLVLKESQLSDYVFFWRCVGRQLGIDDRYNLCGGGLRVSSTIVHEVPAPVNISV